ncbi:MAG: ZIP family metal transporter [Lachnospiraceae bacterium]
MNGLSWVLLGTGFIFMMTTVGAAVVFLFRGEVEHKVQRVFLGFAAGVMTAASVWSLLIPGIEAAENMKIAGWIPAGGGFVIGGIFMMGLDWLIPHFYLKHNEIEEVHSSLKRTTLLVLAVTLHNIPEGMAVGLAFALASLQGGEIQNYGAAIALALGIGIQNLPEGAAISLPLYQEGMKKRNAFFCGCMSGIVEPIFGLLTMLIIGWIEPYMPWLLAFAAGAMIYVVVEELIPEANLCKDTKIGTIGVMIGFLIMMILDVALR